MPSDVDPYEGALRKTIAEKIVRGHVDVRVHFTRNTAGAGASVNQALLAAWIGAFREAAQRFGLSGEALVGRRTVRWLENPKFHERRARRN